MNFLDLTNFVIRESGSELNELTEDNFDDVVGVRMYPRIKGYVMQAWRDIQTAREEWEFNQATMYADVFPRFKFRGGAASTAPSVGTEFKGAESGFTFTVREWLLDEGDWEFDPASGQVEFEEFSGDGRIIPGELFEEQGGGDASFEYLDRGSYSFGLDDPDLSEINWSTFVGSQNKGAPIQMVYIPWESWLFKSYDYAVGSMNPPVFMTQDPFGKVMFLQQTFQKFKVSFQYAPSPQTLESWDDEPRGLKPRYHEWIAWEALVKLATYDKNKQLFAHAKTPADTFRRRAESKLMPIVYHARSRFNV